MLKNVLLGLEMLSSTAIPNSVNHQNIIKVVQNLEMPKKRIKRAGSNNDLANDKSFPKPALGQSKVAMLYSDWKDNKFYKYVINPKTTGVNNEDLNNYNSLANWEFRKGNSEFDKIVPMLSSHTIGLFPKIVGKKVFMESRTLTNSDSKFDFSHVETTTEMEYGGIFDEQTFREVKVGYNFFSIPEIKDTIGLTSWAGNDANDEAKYYYINNNILNENGNNPSKDTFLIDKIGKKFLVRRILLVPKIKISNPATSKTNLIIDNVYLNGNKLNIKPFKRSLHYEKAETDFSLNKDDFQYQVASQNAIRRKIGELEVGNTIANESVIIELAKYGFEFTGAIISVVPLGSAVSALGTVANFIVYVLSDKDNTPIDSEEENKMKNGGNYNEFSIEVTDPIALKWGEPAQLVIENITLEGNREHWNFTDKFELKLDNMEIEFEGEWVDDNYSTLTNTKIDGWTSQSGSTRYNSITGEKIINE